MNAALKKEFFIDIFFPNRCALCGGVIKWDIPYSGECYEALPRTGKELCRGCGEDISMCGCGKEKYGFSRIYAAFYYDGIAKEAVLHLKEHKNTVFPDIVAEKLCDDMAEDGYSFNADFIVPIPMTKRKLSIKGFNHAEEIAKALSRLTDIPVKGGALVKYPSLFAQHTLSAEMRKSNASGLYGKGDSEGIKGKRIILCDDVKTTGSTLNECAEILLEAGAADVIAVAAAVTAK